MIRRFFGLLAVLMGLSMGGFGIYLLFLFAHEMSAEVGRSLFGIFVGSFGFLGMGVQWMRGQKAR